MNMPSFSWRPTTSRLITAAVAIVCLLVGFWIGWQHRSSVDPSSVTPSVPTDMRTGAAHVTVPATHPTGTSTTATVPGTSSTTSTPAAPLPPRSQLKIAVFNAGATPGVAVQLAVSIVGLGYPTPATGNISLPANQLPTPSGTSITTTNQATTGPSTAPSTATGTTTAASTSPTSSSPAPPAEPQIIYYRSGDQAIAQRLGTDLGIGNVAPVPTTGPLVSTATSAQLIVVVGGG